jgi:hypothetical protein
MCVLLMARDGREGRHLAAKLAEEGLIDAVLFESGAKARWRKFKRHFRAPPWRWPAKIRDVFALRAYARWHDEYISGRLERTRPLSIPVFACGDANDPAARKALADLKPALVLVFGTAILKEEVLKAAPLFLNIHGGLVPKYRNVHSEFWAFLSGKSGEIGTSILHVRPGIDDGPVALQRAVNSGGVSSLREARLLNFKLACELAAEAVRAWRDGSLASRPQERSQGRLYPTPSCKDFEQLCGADSEFAEVWRKGR